MEDEADNSLLSDTDLVTRGSMTLGYDNLATDHQVMISHLLATNETLETELGYLPHRWQHHWGLLEPLHARGCGPDAGPCDLAQHVGKVCGES